MIRVGTRTSQLARAQAGTVADQLRSRGHEAELVGIENHGDASRALPIARIGVAGAFTAALEQALMDDRVDLAVHSLKDLPIAPLDGLELAAILPRGSAEDALLIRPEALDPHAEGPIPLVEGARVATSGPRRQTQLRAVCPDLVVVDVRGNVDTRLTKLQRGWFDALVMARVAIQRADLDTDGITVASLPTDRFPSAPGQAAIAVEARTGTPAAKAAGDLDHRETRQAVQAERQLLARLGGGCGLPMGAHAHRSEEAWHLTATYAYAGWPSARRVQLERVRSQGKDLEALVDDATGPLLGAQQAPAQQATPAPEPADGPRLLVVASAPTADRYASYLAQAGFPAQPLPPGTFEPGKRPDLDTLARFRSVDWVVVTSRQAIEPLAELLGDELPDAAFATVGPGTARAMRAHDLPVHLVAPERTGQSLGQAIADLADEGARVLLALGDRARPEPQATLETHGLETTVWTAYTTHPVERELGELEPSLPAAAALVMSPASARWLPLDHADRLAERFVAFGPSTSQALDAAGLPHAVCQRPTPEAVIDTLEEIL